MRLAAGSLAALRGRLQRLVRPLPDDYLALCAAGSDIGALSPEFAARVAQPGGALFAVTGQRVELTAHLRGEALGTAWGELADTLRSEGWFRAWRNESYDVRLGAADAAAPVLCRLERGTFRRFGLRSRAVHLNAVTADGRMWVARRAASKAIDPDRLDNLVGGGIASGESVTDTLLRECAEEAGMAAALARQAQAMPVLHARREEDEGMHDEWLHPYCLTVPDDFVPRNLDGEVAGFMLLQPAEVAAHILADAFTEDAAAVAACWLLQRAD